MDERKPTLDYGGVEKPRRIRFWIPLVTCIILTALVAELFREWWLYGKWAFLVG